MRNHKPGKSYRNSLLHACTCEVLREQRERAGLTQLAVSALMGKSEPYCNRVERGVRMLNHIEFMFYCRAIHSSAAFVAEEAERRVLMKNQPLQLKRK